MGWEELRTLSDRELLLLLHERVQKLENKVDARWQATWRVLAWGVGIMISLSALFIAGHAAKLW